MKSDASDELINTHLLRPIAGLLVRGLYHTRVTPNGVTLAALVSGVLSATLFSFNTPALTALGGLSLTLKDVLDSADGQLARAKNAYSRAGRFLDSLGDVLVNFMVIGVITTVLTRATGNLWMPLLGFLAFLGTTLRVSYHVFYQTSYLHLQKKYNLNRVTEGFTAEDETADPLTRRLQTAFLIVYGWQDRMMVRVDAWCRSEIMSDQHTWYSDRIGLRLSGFLGLGTELFILMTFSVFNALEGYLYVNLMAMNALWLACIVYRRVILSRRLRVQRNIL